MNNSELSGMIRRPEEFAAACRVIKKRVIGFNAATTDPELFVQYGVLIDACRLAEAISRKYYDETP